MLGFRGIYACALHGRTEEVIDKDKVEALREALGPIKWPQPWIGTDAWLQRFIDRAELAELEPLEKDAETGEEIPHPGALERVQRCLAWREEFGANSILDTTEEAVLTMHRHWPLQIHGEDREGRPVVYESVAKVYPRPFLERYSEDEAFRFAVYSREFLARELWHRTGGRWSRMLFVESAGGLEPV